MCVHKEWWAFSLRDVQRGMLHLNNIEQNGQCLQSRVAKDNIANFRLLLLFSTLDKNQSLFLITVLSTFQPRAKVTSSRYKVLLKMLTESKTWSKTSLTDVNCVMTKRQINMSLFSYRKMGDGTTLLLTSDSQSKVWGFYDGR